MLRNLFALLGVVATVAAVYIGVRINDGYRQVQAFDPGAIDAYHHYASRLLATGNAAEASVRKVRVRNGRSPAEVAGAMRSAAREHGLSDLGKMALSGKIEAITGEKQPLLEIYRFCDPLTAGKLVAFNTAYSAHLPCRISLAEGQNGTLWLYTANIDPMIHGGRPLPEWLEMQVVHLRDALLDIMQRGAAGAV